jgi:hypothetical protein
MTRKGAATRLATFFVCLAPACGGNASHAPSADDSGRDAEHVLPSGWGSAGCPDLSPTVGAPCEGHRLCTYGDSLRGDCRSVVECNGEVWQDDSGECVPLPNEQCPANIPSGECAPTDADLVPLDPHTMDAGCLYDGTFCRCDCPNDGCVDDSPGEWNCEPTDMGICPANLPNLGEPCDGNGAECRYGDPCFTGGVVVCFDGIWSPTVFGCEE